MSSATPEQDQGSPGDAPFPSDNPSSWDDLGCFIPCGGYTALTALRKALEHKSEVRRDLENDNPDMAGVVIVEANDRQMSRCFVTRSGNSGSLQIRDVIAGMRMFVGPLEGDDENGDLLFEAVTNAAQQGQLAFHLSDALSDELRIPTMVAQDPSSIKDLSKRTYVTAFRGTMDLFKWAVGYSDIRLPSACVVPESSWHEIPIKIGFGFEVDADLPSHSMESGPPDRKLQAVFPDLRKTSGTETERIGQPLLAALLSGEPTITENASGQSDFVLSASCPVEVNDSRADLLHPTSSNGYKGTLDVELSLTARPSEQHVSGDDLKQAVSSLLSQEDDVERMVACLSNAYSCPFDPQQRFVWLEEGSEDLAAGHLGSAKWTGRTEVQIREILRPRSFPVDVVMTMNCKSTEGKPLTYESEFTPTRDA